MSAPPVAARLEREIEGEVHFDAFTRGRYSTDASHYQIVPMGVVIPRSAADVRRAVEIAGDAGVSVLARGAGTSQCGQTVGAGLVIDMSRHLDGIVSFSPEEPRITVEPGIVLDTLNDFLQPHGLQFPVDVSTSSRATIGGMAGNNSCGARSIRYGTMRRNVISIDAVLASGTAARFGVVTPESPVEDTTLGALARDLLSLGRENAAEIAKRFPKLQRRVGGYNIDALATNEAVNLSHLLVGSEGTLACSTAIELALAPIPAHRVLGVCHFASFRAAMEATPHIVARDPSAVELVDRTMIELSRDIALYRETVERFVRGKPDALLLVEFAGEDAVAPHRDLRRLVELMADLGHPRSVVEAVDPAFQKQIWEVRKDGLNIMMSMKGDGKPISFIEDCAVPLDDLADYTERLTRIFHRHGTQGTWYAHASEGCLHVRPILNLKLETDARKMRAIAEEAFAMVREYKGSHSGEHGDGLVRSEFHEAMFGGAMVRAFERVKDLFDPQARFNPGKIVRAPRMDERTLFRFPPGYAPLPVETALDWSAWGGFSGAAEMCNNNGACRALGAGVMCPSFRATREEKDLTRGRANTLRLALSGQLGPDALSSEAMAETMRLCVGCKACRRECPAGVDVARMKIEVQHHHAKRYGLRLHDRLVAQLPRYAPLAARIPALLNLRDRLPGAAQLSERLLGFSARRPLPAWRSDPFRPPKDPVGALDGPEVVLFADTFNRWFERETVEDAIAVLVTAGYRVHLPGPVGGGRPLCCGRTFLAVGQVDEARREARRVLDALSAFVRRGVPILGLEPSCLFTLRDEYLAMLPGEETQALADRALLLEEFLAAESAQRRLRLPLRPLKAPRALVHGHCHQKAFGAFRATLDVLRLVPDLSVEAVESSCCGMAGAFGFDAGTYDVSMKMGELSLLPAVRNAPGNALIVADGTSCRQQIRDGAGREATHAARVLREALAGEA